MKLVFFQLGAGVMDSVLKALAGVFFFGCKESVICRGAENWAVSGLNRE